MVELLDLLADLEFPRTSYQVLQKPSINDLPFNSYCGIYVWEAVNREIYAGLSVDVKRRYREHRQTHQDIAVLYFKSVEPAKLASEEKRVIQALEEAGFHLRNKTHTSVSYSPSIFDEVMSSEQQALWLANPEFKDDSGERPENTSLRAKYRANYERFCKMPQSREVVRVLRSYINSTIPAVRRSEFYYWSCSCLPSGSKIIRINLYQQEVLVIDLEGNAVSFQIHLTKSFFLGVWRRRIFKVSSFLRYQTLFPNYFHTSGGTDQFVITVEGSDNFLRLLEQPQIKKAARLFNLRLMRKGTNLNYRSHCFDLADDIHVTS